MNATQTVPVGTTHHALINGETLEYYCSKTNQKFTNGRWVNLESKFFPTWLAPINQAPTQVSRGYVRSEIYPRKHVSGEYQGD
ncbi:hypothetical protein HYG89_06430 [Acinetobacter sp. SwsAc5]|uniref:hypothetical protein n=1 Tax=Acinetobacter sp. SwsAc5 TaxID=2749438 RepID=UPI0015BB84CC|nr:hypothetical protein [Acinetobacter sp. SwsAc5]NWK52197.1 hypothetical protein [Acinetobacter sp. SwsAc5]